MYTWYNDVIIIIVIIIIVSAENVNFHPSLWNAYQLRSQIKTVYRYIYASVGLLSNFTYYTYIYTCADYPVRTRTRIAPLLLRQYSDTESRNRDNTIHNIPVDIIPICVVHTHKHVLSVFMATWVLYTQYVLYIYIKCFEVMRTIFRIRSD